MGCQLSVLHRPLTSFITSVNSNTRDDLDKKSFLYTQEIHPINLPSIIRSRLVKFTLVYPFFAYTYTHAHGHTYTHTHNV